jgi:hypothetical protein
MSYGGITAAGFSTFNAKVDSGRGVYSPFFSTQRKKSR